MLLFLSVLLFFIALFPYMIYLWGIYFGRKPDEIIPPLQYPAISIVMSAYNEEQVIEKRITNIQECHYPKESMEIIFVDDLSSDNTKNLAKLCLERSKIPYQIIANAERLGTNRSYNSAIARANYPIIVTTDADVFFEPDALNYLIGRLLSNEKIAAVTADSDRSSKPIALRCWKEYTDRFMVACVIGKARLIRLTILMEPLLLFVQIS